MSKFSSTSAPETNAEANAVLGIVWDGCHHHTGWDDPPCECEYDAALWFWESENPSIQEEWDGDFDVWFESADGWNEGRP